jgi:hypothetical protein
VDFSSAEIVDATPGKGLTVHISAIAARPSGIGGAHRQTWRREWFTTRSASDGRGSEGARAPYAGSNFLPLSPFDLTSVDDDNQLIYIEVKSTKVEILPRAASTSLRLSFSRLLLGEAVTTSTGSRTSTRSPKITRWPDPLQLIREGSGQLLLAKAQMALTLEKTPRQPLRSASTLGSSAITIT